MLPTPAARSLFPLLLLSLFFCLPFAAGAQLVANFAPDKQGGCSPLAVSFTNQTSGASANAVYNWDFGNGNTSTLRNPGAIFTEEKTYTITLTVTDGAQTATRTAQVTVYKKPTADFSVAAPKVCIPDAANFTFTGSAGEGSITRYMWDFGNGVAQDGWGTTMSHHYTAEQKPAVTLTVVNSFGCYNTITKEGALEILGRINPQFTTDKNLLCNLTEPLKTTNTSTGPGTLRYRWDFGDGTSSTQKEPTHLFARKGVFGVALEVSNTDGCKATSWPVSVNAAFFNTDFSSTLLCREASFSSSSYLWPSSSLWQYGDGFSENGFATAKRVYAQAGSYNVTLVNDYSGCKDTITKTIRVEDKVNFNSAIQAPALLCRDNFYNFSSTSSVQPSNSVWEFGDGRTGWWTQVGNAYNQPGTYTIKLTNTFGTCTETVTRNVVVNELPDLKGFVVDYGGICGAPVNIKFRDTTAGATSWRWNLDWINNNQFSNLQAPAYQFNSDGTYQVYLTVANAAGCTSSTQKAVPVYRPSVTIYYTESSSPRGNYDCDSLTVRLATNANQPLKTYSWDFGDGTTSTEATPVKQYKTIGVYSIRLNYVTESGCSGTAFYSVRVYGKPKAEFRHSIPCGNSLNLQFSDQSYFSDNWQWDFNNNGNLLHYGANPQYTFADTGKYQVRFVSHIGRCSDTLVKEVHANLLPSSVAITKAATTCEGTRGTVTFDQQSLRITSGTWNFGDGTTRAYDTSDHAVKHTYSRTGVYTVTLTGTYNNCTLTSSTQVYIILKQRPVLTANKTEICANEDLSVQVSGMEVNPYTSNSEWGQYNISKFEYNDGTAFTGWQSNYSWRFTSFAATLNNFSAGTSQFRAIVNNSYSGCPDTTNFVNLKVNGPRAGFKVITDAICYKSAIVLEDTSRTMTNTPISTWFWEFGDGQTRTLTRSSRVEHRYAQPGNYLVRLTVTDATGCRSTFSYNVSARGPKAAFTASGLFVPNVPLNTTVTFYNQTMGWFSNTVDYNWQFGDGTTSTNYYGEHTYTRPGTNTVRLIAKDPTINCSDTAIQVIQVKDFNSAFTFTTTYAAGSSCPPALVRINNLSVGTIRVEWDFGDGSDRSTQYYPAHTYTRPGRYRITLYTYGHNGLTGTYKDSVEIKQPTASLAADALLGCTGKQVTLRATAANTQDYFWDFGDGTVLSGKDTFAVHQYRTAGVYQPRLVLKDATGCAASTQLASTIVIDSLATAIKGIPALICDSTTINFTPEVRSFAATRLGQPLAFHWNFGTGTAADTSNVRNAAFNYNKPGTYTVRLRVSSPAGCVQEVSERILVNKKATATITGPVALCEGGTATFSGGASASPVTWAWSMGNGNLATTQNPGTQTYRTPGNYAVRLVVGYNGCMDTAVQQLVVHPNPVTGVTAAKRLVCRGEAVQLTATGGATYAWTPNAGLSNATTAAPLASPVQNTIYRVQVTTQAGCTKTDSIALVVAQPFRLSGVRDTFVCVGSTVQLTAQGASSYRWISNNTGLSNTAVANPVVRTTTDATYTVVGYDAVNCFTDTARVTVAVKPLPTVSAGPNIEMLAAETRPLSATGSPDVVQWHWSPDTYLSCTNCPAPLTSARTPMEYTVTVKNGFGCTASDQVEVKLQCSEEFVYIPNGFTPDGDGKNDLFYIKGKGVGIIKSLVIYSRWGQPVFERHNFNIDDVSAAWDGRFKGALLPAGSYVYFAEMQCANGQPIIKKGTVTLIR